MSNEPITDAEVMASMTEYQDENTRRALTGIYRCRRGMGDSVTDAWIYTLEKHIDAAKDSR